MTQTNLLNKAISLIMNSEKYFIDLQNFNFQTLHPEIYEG
jgi:hypothetical protein